ncbi:MAG: ATP-binding protein [Planctomycetota bacterium]
MKTKRKIIEIDEEKCTGCGLCVPSCHEGALQIVDGKAKLVKDIYCDGLGDCLGECPEDALHIIEREADEFDEKAVEEHLKNQAEEKAPEPPLPCGCPGSAMMNFTCDEAVKPEAPAAKMKSRLSQWPVQIMLVPPEAPFLKHADLLITADCVPFALPDFHENFLKGRRVLVGCPKLDDNDYYTEKLTETFREADPESISVVRMEVPCCGGIVQAVLQARDNAGLDIPVDVYTVGIREGDVRTETVPPATEKVGK